MEMEKGGWGEEEGWAAHGRGYESGQWDAVGREEKQKHRWREVDRKEQGEKQMTVEFGGRMVERVTNNPYFEVQRERMGWRGKLLAEGEMCVDLWKGGRKVQRTKRREARELRGEI